MTKEPSQWLKDQFEFGYCEECGGDVQMNCQRKSKKQFD